MRSSYLTVQSIAHAPQPPFLAVYNFRDEREAHGESNLLGFEGAFVAVRPTWKGGSGHTESRYSVHRVVRLADEFEAYINHRQLEEGTVRCARYISQR